MSLQTDSSHSPRSSRLVAQVTVATTARLIMNISQRMVYPFLPVIARGLNISMQTAGQLLAIRFAVGVLSPLFGPLSDRFGRRQMMAGALIALTGGALLVLVPGYPAIVAGFVLLGLAKAVFDPSLLAYLGDRIPYHRLGRLIAIVELAWGGALVVGAPLIGWIIGRWGWQSSFLFVAVTAPMAMAGLMAAVPRAHGSDAESSTHPIHVSLRQVLGSRSAVAALGVAFLMMASSELQFIVYGPWMETIFDLSVSGLGLATMVIGTAEILGEIGVGGLVDRLGKRRSVAAGLALAALSYLALPVVSSTLTSARVALFVLFAFFEFTVVANLPLTTELVPGARATMLSLMVASGALGRMAGAWAGPLLWEQGGMAWNSTGAGLGMVLALALLLAFVREGAVASARSRP